MEIACERLLQSTGKTIYSMYTQGLGAIINIILDPILIFGYFGRLLSELPVPQVLPSRTDHRFLSRYLLKQDEKPRDHDLSPRL